MKTVFKLLAIAFLVVLISTCSTYEKSYYYKYSSNICYQVNTSDSSLQQDLENDGYYEGICKDQGYTSSYYCQYWSTEWTSSSVEKYIYFPSSYSYSNESSTCSSDGGSLYYD